MNTPLYTTLIPDLFGAIDQLLNHYVKNGYAVLADKLKEPLGLGVVVYFCVMGISLSQGWSRLSFSAFMKSIIKITIIYMLAMSWQNFSFFFVNGIEGSAGQIGDYLVSASAVALPHFAGSGINGALQSVLIEVTRVGAWAWQTGSFHNVSPYFNAIVIWIFGFCALAFAIVEILLAKMMLSLFFTLAPLFIALTLFKSTQGLFDRWLGDIIGFSLFLIMIPAALTLALNVMHWSVSDLYASRSGTDNIVAWVPIMIVGILDLILIKNVASFAKSIGGGVSTASGSSMLAAGIGSFLGSAIAKKGLAQGITKIAQSSGSGAQTAFQYIKNASPIMESLRNKLRGQK